MGIELPEGMFSPREVRILEMLLAGGDVAVDEIYEKHVARGADARRRLQHVGAIASQMNQKLTKLGFRIVPGVARRTYKLTQSKEVK